MDSDILIERACKKLQELLDATKKYSVRVLVQTLCKKKWYGCLCIIVVRKKSFTSNDTAKVIHQFIKLRSRKDLRVLTACIQSAKITTKVVYKNYWYSAHL